MTDLIFSLSAVQKCPTWLRQDDLENHQLEGLRWEACWGEEVKTNLILEH